MIVSINELGSGLQHDICVVGAGPLGVGLALRAAERGRSVLIIEAGGTNPGSDSRLSQCDVSEARNHAALKDACCNAIGGTSHWWGGRCVPFDQIDFDTRDWVDFSGWPVSYAEVAAYFDDAARFFGLVDGNFKKSDVWPSKDILSSCLERWAPNPNVASVHGIALRRSEHVRLLPGSLVTGLDLAPDRTRVNGIRLRSGDEEHRIHVRQLVLASGGVQTVRLLLDAQQLAPDLFGGPAGPLGRYYMGHNFGKIANLVLNNPAAADAFTFELDEGSYSRRRVTFPPHVQRRHKLLNTAFTLGNAQLSNPSHQNGALSLIWLALASPLGKRLLPQALLKLYVGQGSRKWGAHLANVIRTAGPTAVSAWRIYRDKFLRRPGVPAILLHSAAGRYTVQYHAEQTPDPDNRLQLSTAAPGRPHALKIRSVFSRDDAQAIVRSHRLLDQAMRAAGVGHLEFTTDDDAVLAAEVVAQAGDGMHQIGAARMSSDPALGVVDENCRVHGLTNLFVASTCVFPTSGQANPTLLGVALALRLADHLTADLPQNQVEQTAAR
jgi:choline dehydrogenase-like flavoprotein